MASTLWTDLITPAEATGYVRESMADLEKRKGTLARFLPNRVVPDTTVRFTPGQHGLIEAAQFRAFDAEASTGALRGGKRVALELPALGRNIPVTEHAQLRQRNASEELLRNSIFDALDDVAVSVTERMELLRATVLRTGRATVAHPDFAMDDDFGRSAANNVAPAGAKWSDPNADIIGDLTKWKEIISDSTGEEPGALVVSSKVLGFIRHNKAFAVNLLNGASRPASLPEAAQILEDNDLPAFVRYDRRVLAEGKTQRVLPENEVLLLPAPVEPDDYQGTRLGATFWGQTLTGDDPDWGIQPVDAPGVVAGIYRHKKPPMIAEVVSDAIGMPVLANADLSLRGTVL